MSDLIRVTQLPVIEERLRDMKEQIQLSAIEALNLACTADTLASVKAARADLSKLLGTMEEQRKGVKAAIMEPYERFEAIYRECISDPIKSADAELKGKITEVEDTIKDACEAEMREFFVEMTQAQHVEWLTYERMGLAISLSEAKTKSHKKLREQIAGFITGVAEDVNSISTMEGADEILLEYKDSLSLSFAVGTVFERHRRIEEEHEAANSRRAAQGAAREAAEKAERVYMASAGKPLQPPTEASTAVSEREAVYKLSFAVHGTKAQLVKFKSAFVDFCEKEGIRYE